MATPIVVLKEDLDAEATERAAVAADVAAIDARLSTVETGQTSGFIAVAEFGDLTLDYDAGTVAVLDDGSSYRKVGASGAGSWTLRSEDRVSVVEASLAAKFDDNVPTTRNLYDPDLAVDGHYLQTTLGTESVNADWAWSGIIPVDELTRYTFSNHDATGTLYPTVHFFGSGGFGSWLGSVDGASGLGYNGIDPADIDLVVTPDSNQLSFTTPASAAYCAVVIIHAAVHNTAYFNTRRAACMLQLGNAATAFETYTLGPRLKDDVASGRTQSLELRVDTLESPIVVEKSGSSYYLHSPWRGDQQIVAEWGFDSRSGLFQPQTVSLRPDVASIIQASTPDEAPPLRLNGGFIGGNHGHIQSLVTTSPSAHGETNEDVGSVWSDGASAHWVLLEIVDATYGLQWAREDYTINGDGTYTVPSTFTGSTLTHVSGATHTGPISVSGHSVAQMYPSVREITTNVLTDQLVDLVAAGDGLYPCKHVSIAQYYEINSLPSMIDFAKANVGSSSPLDYTDPSIDTLVYNFEGYHIPSAREFIYYRRFIPVEPVLMSGCVALQANSLIAQTGSGRYVMQYIPDTLVIGGQDFANGVDITAGVSDILTVPATWADADTPPNRMMQVMFESDDSPVIGLSLEIDQDVGIGRPSQRKALLGTGYATEVSAAKKMYMISAGNGTTPSVVAAGTHLEYRARRKFFYPSDFGFGD